MSCVQLLLHPTAISSYMDRSHWPGWPVHTLVYNCLLARDQLAIFFLDYIAQNHEGYLILYVFDAKRSGPVMFDIFEHFMMMMIMITTTTKN